MQVRLLHVAAPLQDLGVRAVAAKQPLLHAKPVQLAQGKVELSISRFGVGSAIRDLTQPHVGLGDIRPLVEPLGELERFVCELIGVTNLTYLKAQLAKAEQHIAATGLQVGLLKKAQRAVEMLPGLDVVALGQHDQAEVVLGARQRQSVVQDLEQSDRPVGKPGRRLDLSSLAVGVAETVVHECKASQVEQRAGDVDRPLVDRDRLVPLLARKVDGGEDREQPRLGGLWNWLQVAADRQRAIHHLPCTRTASPICERSLRAKALGKHQLVVDCLEMAVRLAEKARGRFHLAEVEVCVGEVESDPAQPVSRRPEIQQPLTQGDGFIVPARGHQLLELDEPGKRLVGGAAWIGEKVLDRLPGTSSDVLERRERWPRPASLDEVDGRGRDLPLAELCQAQSCFRARLLDGPLLEGDARQPAASCCAWCTRRGGCTLRHRASLAQSD